MNHLLLFLFIYPFVIFGQNAIIDTTCICGKRAPKITKTSFFVVQEMPVYPGGYEALKKYLKTNIKLDSTENGKILIGFIISCKGNTCGFRVLDKEGPLSLDVDAKIIDILKGMDVWEPGKQRFATVDVPWKIPITITKGVFK